MAEKGLPGFVDKAGRQWSPEAYVRMDLRSTMGNTARAAQDARCDEWGIQLIEVSSHNGARPKCAPYQGRIFSRDGSRGVTRDLDGNQIEYIPLSETSYGEPDGLFGINCGHQQYPFIPGVSVRSYYPYPEEENAERYQQMQQQRAMERRIRDDKRECMMLQETGDEEGLKKAAGKLRADKDRYRDFCKETGLGAHNENTQVYGYDRSKSAKTVWAEKKGLTSDASGGIIKNKKFNTLHDPMFEVTGPAEISNPNEIKALEEHISSLGATLIRPDIEELNYQPGLMLGEPGRVVISKNASYSAWLHEVKHLDDDYADGYLGMRVFADPQKCIQREIDAYEIEIQLAKKAGRNDIVKRLEALRDEEITNYK